jgi:hypothetical protein
LTHRYVSNTRPALGGVQCRRPPAHRHAADKHVPCWQALRFLPTPPSHSANAVPFLDATRPDTSGTRGPRALLAARSVVRRSGVHSRYSDAAFRKHPHRRGRVTFSLGCLFAQLLKVRCPLLERITLLVQVVVTVVCAGYSFLNMIEHALGNLRLNFQPR